MKNTLYTETAYNRFIAQHTTRIVERKIEVTQRNGVTVRTMTEIVVWELNDNLLGLLLNENQFLKNQLAEAERVQGDRKAETCAIILLAAILSWKLAAV